MEEQIYITIAKVLHGEADEAERRVLDAWLLADRTNADIFNQMKATWGETNALFDAPLFNAAPAWEKVSARIHQPKPAELPKRSRTIGLPSWVKYSSAIAAILLVALFIWNPFSNGMIRVAASDGNTTIELPDHSIITLRKGSTLSYSKSFAAPERKVSLEGEAFFEVTRNVEQPFMVDAQAVAVKVLGTAFNIQCSEDAADVTVANGSVEVTAQSNTAKKVVVTPGRKAHYSKGDLTQTAATGSEASWKNIELSFNNEPFSSVIEAIAKAKDTALQFDSGVLPIQQQQAVTVSFRNQSLEDMLTELCLITNCSWQKRGTTYIIRTK